MGQRANLFVVTETGTELYYSHWRANTLDRDLFWGPEVATAFARAQRSEAEGASLLDDVWCEGAAVIDHTTRTLLWFGGEGTCYSVPRRRLHYRMMRFFWPGWTIRWAYEGIADVADYLGIPRDRVCKADYYQSEDLSSVLDTPKDPSWSLTMISIRQGGRNRFLAITSDLEFFFSAGEEFLELLRGREGEESFNWNETGAEFPTGGLHVDFDARELFWWYSANTTCLPPRAATIFPNWNMIWWVDEYEAHVRAAPGLTLSAPDQTALSRSLIDYLLGEERDSSDLITELTAKLIKGERDVEVNPLAQRDDPLTLTVAERRKLLAELLTGTLDTEP